MNTERELIHAFLHEGKYDAITKVAEILHPGKKAVSVTESYVDRVRLVTDDESINILIPRLSDDEQHVMESAVSEAIETGTIYDDAENVKDASNLIRLTTLPNLALAHKDLSAPDCIEAGITPVISKMDNNGRFEVSDADVKNGVNCVRDLTSSPETSGDEVRRVMDNYIANKSFNTIETPEKAPVDIAGIFKNVSDIKQVDAADTLSPENYDEVDYQETEVDEELKQEGFITHRPKKLKPIPRDIISYVTNEIRNMQDTRDQAMWAGYVSNKLEFVDFYITVIDTNDERFIVPHTRDYLVNMQRDLNRLLTQILHTKPYNKYDRVWQMNLPDGYQG